MTFFVVYNKKFSLESILIKNHIKAIQCKCNLYIKKKGKKTNLNEGYYNYLELIWLIKEIIIIIISCWQHGYPWPSLATPPYRSSP